MRLKSITDHPSRFGGGRGAAARRPLLFMRPRTFVYTDGFNFYYACIRRTPNRWLDFFRFSQAILPKNEIVKVLHG